MNLDGLTLSVLIRELNDQVGSGQIQRIQQIDKTSILGDYRRQRSLYLCYRYDSGCPQGAYVSHYVFTQTY